MRVVPSGADDVTDAIANAAQYLIRRRPNAQKTIPACKT